MKEGWDLYGPMNFDPPSDSDFLQTCSNLALKSPDPSTKVGAVIVDKDRGYIARGINNFPAGIRSTRERWQDRETKLRLVVHAEMNAVLKANRRGYRTQGSTLYLAATDATGDVWGGPPCTRCTVELIQAGVIEIVSYPMKAVPSRWREDIEYARGLLVEAGIIFREIPRKA